MSFPVHRSVPVQTDMRADAGRIHLPFILGEVVLLVLLGLLAIVVRGHPGPLTGDVGVERDIQLAILPHTGLTNFLEALSTLNWPKPTAVTMAVIIALFLLLRRWLDAIVVPIAAAISSVTTFELSHWVHRVRPHGHGIHVLQAITSTYSFPSGHVAYAVTVFGLFLFLTTQVRRAVHPALIWIIRLVLLLVILLMPVSRMVEGEHWPSDVLAGALDGLFWLAIFAHVYLWARSRWPVLLARDER